MVFLLLFAGHETTTHLISGSVLELLKNRDSATRSRKTGAVLDLAIEEFLRFITPVQFTKPRYVRRDIDLGGVPYARATRSWPCWRPPTWILKPIRNPSDSICSADRTAIAFGTGIHFCLGHQLARIEARCALKSLFRRWPKLRLAVDNSESRGENARASRRLNGFQSIRFARRQLDTPCKGCRAQRLLRGSNSY